MGYGCTCCSRTILVELNIIMMIAGLAMVGLLLWVRFDPHFEPELKQLIMSSANNYNLIVYKDQIQFGINLAWYVLGGFGVAGAVIGFFGVCGSCCNFRCLNGFYMIFLIIMTALEIAVGVFIYIWKTRIYETLYNYIATAFQTQTDDGYILKNRFNCCGVGGQTGVCNQNDRSCYGDLVNRLDLMFIIAGIAVLGIAIFQLLAIILAGVVVCCGKSNKVQ